MSFYEDLEKSLLEAIEMERGFIPTVEKPGMPAKTIIAAEYEKRLIDELVKIRKEQNISQNQLATMTGSKQQAISRFENKEHSPSLKMFASIVNALGYDIKIVKRVWLCYHNKIFWLRNKGD